MTTLELARTVDTVNSMDADLLAARRAMETCQWRQAIDQLHGVMNRLHDATGLRAYVETAWTDVDSPRASVMMFQEAPPRFRIDLLLQLARGAANGLEHGSTDHAQHDLMQLQVILDLLKSRLSAA